jgi:L-lactate dehydrogenase complex protein LldG
MNSRDKILYRLGSVSIDPVPTPQYPGDRQIYLDFPEKPAVLLDTFKQQITLLSGEFHLTGDTPQAADVLYEIIKGFPPRMCLVQNSELIDQVIRARKDLEAFLDRSFALDADSLAYSKFTAGITTAECLIARSGSVLLTSTAAGRRLSVLPPVHIVLARQNQIVPSLADAYARLTEKSMNWSYAVLITGPSRTSDIEKQLVLGAHGPKRLIVIILES